MLGRFWLAHHDLFSGIVRFDRGLMVLNLLYLAWVVLVPFATGVFGEFSGDPEGIAVYAVTLAVLSVLEDLNGLYAARAGLMAPEAEARERAAGPWARLLVPAVFLGAIPVAYISPDYAPLVWLLLLPAGRWLEQRR